MICVLQQYPFDIPTEAFSFEIFKQAFVAIQSCVVHLQVIFIIFGFPLHNLYVLPCLKEYLELNLIIWSYLYYFIAES